jgi:glycosyltransferase involved in cell wall biosynthesis
MLNHLYPPFAAGGSEKATAMLAEALVRAGHSVAVVTLHRQRRESMRVENGVRVYRLPLDNVHWPFPPLAHPDNVFAKVLWRVLDTWNGRAARRVGSILDRERPEVFHTNVTMGFSSAVWRAARRRGCRVVHTLHDYQLVCAKTSLFRNGRVCERRCWECAAMTFPAKSACHEVDHVVGVSDFVLQAHRRFGCFRDTGGSTIYNIQPMQPCLLPPPAGRRSGPLAFGYMGRISEEKGIVVLLQATKHLRHHDWTLHIAGVGDDAFVARLQREFADPRIRWLGFVERDALLDAVDVMVVPSVWSEPMGYVALEAMAKGKGLIAARSGGLQEIAALAAHAVTYEARNAPELAQRMDAMMDAPELARSGGFAEPGSAARFTEAHVVAAYERAYRPSVT